MAKVVRLTNPDAFKRDEVQALFKEAFEKNPLADYDKVIGELVLLPNDPLVGLFIGAEKGALRGLVIACLPRSALTPIPTIYHLYNAGSTKLRELLFSAMVDFFLQAGYTSFWGINTTGRDDKAYIKMLSGAGEGHLIGSFLEFKIG